MGKSTYRKAERWSGPPNTLVVKIDEKGRVHWAHNCNSRKKETAKKEPGGKENGINEGCPLYQEEGGRSEIIHPSGAMRSVGICLKK